MTISQLEREARAAKRYREERNNLVRAIYEARSQGASTIELANAMGLSRQRTDEIIQDRTASSALG